MKQFEKDVFISPCSINKPFCGPCMYLLTSFADDRPPMTFYSTLGTSPGQQLLPKQPSCVPPARTGPNDPATFPTLASSLLRWWRRTRATINLLSLAYLPSAVGAYRRRLLRHPPFYKAVPAQSAGLSRTCSAEYEETLNTKRKLKRPKSLITLSSRGINFTVTLLPSNSATSIMKNFNVEHLVSSSQCLSSTRI